MFLRKLVVVLLPLVMVRELMLSGGNSIPKIK